MSFLTNKRAKKALISILSIALALALIIIAGGIYVSDYYRADTEAVEAHKEVCDGYASLEFIDDNIAVFAPEGATSGFIFYPGGKVEFSSYLPLLAECAERGVLCVIVKMPFNLAVLDVNAADGIKERFPNIEGWYIGGHSLGGSMAASYVEKNIDAFDGLILLGAYSTANVSDSSLRVLSIYGSEDGVMNREKYEKYKPNLPDGFTEYVIDGGCHAYFGKYGEQEGDNPASISADEQIEITADKIAEFILD